MMNIELFYKTMICLNQTETLVTNSELDCFVEQHICSCKSRDAFASIRNFTISEWPFSDAFIKALPLRPATTKRCKLISF